MVKRNAKSKRSAQDASLSDQSSLASREQVSCAQTSNHLNEECVDKQLEHRANLINTPRISDQFSSTRMWSKLSEKIDKQYDLMREHNESTRKQIRECEERISEMFRMKIQIIERELVDVKEKLCALQTVSVEINELKNELTVANEKIIRLELKLNEPQMLQTEIQNLKLKVQRHENSAIASDLRINGIPFVENENLFHIFNDICKTINISTPAIKSIFRLKNLNNKRDSNSPDAVIIVRMCSPYDKNFFLKTLSFLRKNNKDFRLCLRQIGFESNMQFFINENLTQTNYQILQAANRLKRQKRLHGAFTIHGLVYIKQHPDDRAVRIDELDQLSDLDVFTPICHGTHVLSNVDENCSEQNS